MKIKDLPKNTNLGCIKVKTPTGEVGYWVSQWSNGVFLKNKLKDTKVTPYFVEDLKECLEWEVIQEK